VATDLIPVQGAAPSRRQGLGTVAWFALGFTLVGGFLTVLGIFARIRDAGVDAQVPWPFEPLLPYVSVRWMTVFGGLGMIVGLTLLALHAVRETRLFRLEARQRRSSPAA